jgi:hypothetical protein
MQMDNIPFITNGEEVKRVMSVPIKCQYCGGDTAHVRSEIVAITRVCTCPTGPIWGRIVDGVLGQALKLAENLCLPYTGTIVFYDVTRDALIQVAANHFREGVINYTRQGGPL